MTNVLITAAHLAALSMIESGNRDHAVGQAGEVTRYQIRPQEWRKAWADIGRPWLAKNTADESGARIVAWHLLQKRANQFAREHRRAPDARELYLLWHRPARVLTPLPHEAERAGRFANLVEHYQRESAPGTMRQKAAARWPASNFASPDSFGKAPRHD